MRYEFKEYVHEVCPLTGPRETSVRAINARGHLAYIVPRMVSWSVIVFVSPITILAACMLIPNAAELAGRILYRPVAPRQPLTLMLLLQIALIALPMMTVVSLRRGRRKLSCSSSTLAMILLAVGAFVAGLYAYICFAAMVAQFGP